MRQIALQKLLLAAGVENFIVGAGGDLIVRGARGAAPWQVGIRDPRGSGLLAVSPISNRAVATSGDYEQFISVGWSPLFSHSRPAKRQARERLDERDGVFRARGGFGCVGDGSFRDGKR